MILKSDVVSEIVKSIKDKIGTSKVSNSSLNLTGVSPNNGKNNLSKIPLDASFPINNLNGQKNKTPKKTIDTILELSNIKNWGIKWVLFFLVPVVTMQVPH